MVNYIPEPIRKTGGGFRDKAVSLFKINTPKDYGKQTVYQKHKNKNNLKKTIKSIRNLFKLKKENEVIKDRPIKNIRTLFKQEEDDYYKPTEVGNFWNNNYIEYQSNDDRNKNYQ